MIRKPIDEMGLMMRNLCARLREGKALSSEQAVNFLAVRKGSGLISECNQYVATWGDDPKDSETFNRLVVGGGPAGHYHQATFADFELFVSAFGRQRWLVCESRVIRKALEQFD